MLNAGHLEDGMQGTPECVIADFIRDNFVFDGTAVDPEASFLESGLIDSTGILELVLFVEETFGITVADDEVIPEHFDSVRRLAAYVRRKLAEERPSVAAS
jgi:acyl carrier protein